MAYNRPLVSRNFRTPGDDFYCWRFAVWYDSLDCAIRTRFRTAPGCRDCAQGRENLRQRLTDVSGLRIAREAIGFADRSGDAPEPPAPVRRRSGGYGSPFRIARLVHSR